MRVKYQFLVRFANPAIDRLSLMGCGTYKGYVIRAYYAVVYVLQALLFDFACCPIIRTPMYTYAL